MWCQHYEFGLDFQGCLIVLGVLAVSGLGAWIVARL